MSPDDSASGPGSARHVWAAVPFKGPVGSKRRLADLLSDEERARLSLAMLQDVLGVLLAVPDIDQVLLLTPRARMAQPGASRRLRVVEEESVVGGLNGALKQAQAEAVTAGADALLIVPADLPLLAAADIEAVLAAGSAAGIVAAPDGERRGTNALLLGPPDALVTEFGEESFGKHRALAAASGFSWTEVVRPGLALDVDTPADIERLLTSERESRAQALLRELGVEARLAERRPG